jgi:hypothetical protein
MIAQLVVAYFLGLSKKVAAQVGLFCSLSLVLHSKHVDAKSNRSKDLAKVLVAYAGREKKKCLP